MTIAGGGGWASSIPGDPAAIETAAEVITTTGAGLDATGDLVRAHADAATGAWFGSAGEAARVSLDRSVGYVRSYAHSTSAAAPVMLTYAAALRAAQARYAQAYGEHASAVVALVGLEQSHDAASAAVSSAAAAARGAGSANAAEAAAAAGAAVAAELARVGRQIEATTARVHAAEDGMRGALGDLAAADAVASAALNALTGDLEALGSAITHSHPAPTVPAPRAASALAPVSTPAARTAASRTAAPQKAPKEEHEGFLQRGLHAVDHFVEDHAAGLKQVSGGLKVVSAAAGVLSLVPVLAPVTAPLAVATGAAAVGIDAVVKLSTGEGSWTQIGVDAALMVLPGVGKVVGKALEGTALAAGARGAAQGLAATARRGVNAATRASRVATAHLRGAAHGAAAAAHTVRVGVRGLPPLGFQPAVATPVGAVPGGFTGPSLSDIAGVMTMAGKKAYNATARAGTVAIEKVASSAPAQKTTEDITTHPPWGNQLTSATGQAKDSTSARMSSSWNREDSATSSSGTSRNTGTAASKTNKHSFPPTWAPRTCRLPSSKYCNRMVRS